MTRHNRHRAPVRKSVTPLVSVLAVVLGLVAVTWAVLATVFGGDDSESTAPAPQPSASAPASPSAWPVETEAPQEDVVPGEGTFLDPGAVDRTDPDAVAAAAATLYGSHDTVLDDSESDSRERVAPLLDPSLLEIPQPENPSPGGLWLVAQEHDAYSLPVATPLPIPALERDHAGETAEFHEAHSRGAEVGMPTSTADGEPALAYYFDVLYHWQGRDGWVSVPETGQHREVRLTLVERDGQWVVVKSFYGSPVVVGVK